jgi:putative flippase GtrA
VTDNLIDSAIGVGKRHGAKLFRFGAVSAFNVVFGQTLLFGAQTLMGWTAVASNVFSVAMSAAPAYLLSRYWVWQKRGKNHFMREVVPFWSLALLGFALSTVAIWYVERRWDPQPVFINLTNMAAFGVVWMSKYFILDRVLFKHEDLTDEPLDALVSEIVHHGSNED